MRIILFFSLEAVFVAINAICSYYSMQCNTHEVKRERQTERGKFNKMLMSKLIDRQIAESYGTNNDEEHS